jgi:hypothetical protein
VIRRTKSIWARFEVLSTTSGMRSRTLRYPGVEI